MMITIHGFPAKTKFQDVKMLIKQECNINDFILDNLLNDTDGTKKVRIGLADNTEGFKVMKCLDGYRMPGNFILKAVPIGKAASSQPPQESSFDSRPSYQNQTRNDYPNAPRNDYMGQGPNDYNNQGSHVPGAPHSHGGIHGSVGSHGPGAPLSHGGIHGSHAPVGPHGPRTSQVGPHSHGAPPSSMDNRPSPWVSGGGNNANQWNTPMSNQVPQNTFGFSSPQTNVNPSYGQQPHQSHPRAPFNQARAGDQGYGYTPKNVPEVVPANSRYRWFRKAVPEPKDPKSPHPDEDSSSPSSVDDLDETSQDVLDYVDKQGPGESTNKLDPSKTTKSKKARKREQARLRNISNLTGAKRRRLFFWLKQGKTFMEARELCETRHNRIPEYPAAKAEQKRKKRDLALRRMSPERQARAIKVGRLRGLGIPGAPLPERPPGQPIRVRILDELGRMSQEKIEMLEDKILDLVDGETDGNEPRFVGYSGQSGCLLLSCANIQTIEWLENHLPDLHLWEGANIKIINLRELPKSLIGIAYVADPDLDDEDILSMLEFQNEGIDFSNWWINDKKPDFPAGQTVIFSIDKCSVDKLAERNFLVYLGSKKIKIRIRSKYAQAPPGQGMLPPMKQMDMPPNPSMGQKVKGPKGKMDMPPKGQTGVAPMYQMGMGPMGMGPMNQIGMGSLGPIGMGPMGPIGMGPIRPMNMGPMGPMGMGPVGMGPMDPVGIGPMGSMGQIGFYPSASNSAEMYGPPQGSYASGFSQPKHFGGGNQSKHFKGGNQPKKFGGGNERRKFGGGNQPKHFSGGGKHSKKKPSGTVNNNSGPNPQQGNAPKKLNPSKAKRSKERMMEYILQNKGKKSWKKPKGGAPSLARVETRHNSLRSIETVDTSVTHPPIHGRYPASQPYHQDKPHTIMKDNFQGPTPYNITNPGGQYSASASSSWQPQASKAPVQPYDKQYDERKYIQPDARNPKAQPIRTEPQERTYKDYEKRRGFSPRRSPNGRRVSPEPVRRVSPPGRRNSPPVRRASPPVRRDSPPGRRVSPSGRRVSPTGRRVSPPGRRISPHARKFSPPGKRTSPDRRIPGHHPAPLLPAPHHPARRESPHKRPSPVRRLVSPTRRPSPGRRDEPQRMPSRYSPDRHHPEKLDKYGQDKLKQVRPAYEPTAHASNQAMYSGGYRETAQYPMQGMRQPEPRISPWQREREDPAGPMKKQDDDRREMSRMQMRDRIPDAAVEAKRIITPQRKSRSPVRRDRSPLRDRYKRHSPSPRSSHSPRRSWALEKRRSPEIRDAPPPPSWPGQNVRDADYPRSRPNFPEREPEKPKHVPVWEPRAIDDDPRGRRPDIPEGRRLDIPERRPFIEDKIRPFKEKPVREPIQPVHSERFVQREPKFTPREEYDVERRDNYRRREPSVERKPHPQHPQREEYDSARRAREHEERPHPDEYHRRREPSPRHDSRKEDLPNPAIDKDFEDIYKKALQFKKKAEELRRVGTKRRDDYLEEEGSRSHHSERERDERPQRYEDRHRFREEELRAREREERPREEWPRDDRPRDDGPRRDYRREDYPKEHDRVEDTRPKRFFIDPNIRVKRDKAVEEISNKILDRHEHYNQLKGEQRNRVLEELKLAIARIVFDMFGDSDVSFIEIIIKYQAKYNLKLEEKILEEVTASLPSPFRVIKRQAPEITEVPAKTRRSQSPHMKPEHAPRPKLSDARWSMNIVPPEVVTLPILGHQSVLPPALNPGIVPMMVPAPYIHPYETLPQNPVFIPEQYQQQPPPQQESQDDEGFKLYLCKDDFEQITAWQADSLKDFLISHMLRESEVSQGWAPDFTLKGLQNSHRYELITKDASTRDWLVNLDFSGFTEFHVIVYTKEELWYERAAVWLPGHSRSRNIEPLDKLKLQNKRLEGVNIFTWKFVKKIITQKGTRLYVDMPPSSARALEKHKLMLSYELQQVNVFLKAVAIDKDAFDAGLKEPSTIDLSVISEAIQNSPMPSLAYDPAIIKITLKGCKTLSLVQARKIKEVLIYHLFRYHQQDGSSRTDFVKYGFFPPNCFGLIPQNPETKKWLLSQHLGKVNRQAIVVMGAEDENTRFFRMYVIVPNEYQLNNPDFVAERLKQSNQGVKGINFNLWKPIKILPDRKKKIRFEVDVDLDSLETLAKMKYQLDYVDLVNTSHTAYFKSEYSYSQLEELIDKCKAEMTDSYDIANMDLDSDSGDDIICLD